MRNSVSHGESHSSNTTKKKKNLISIRGETWIHDHAHRRKCFLSGKGRSTIIFTTTVPWNIYMLGSFSFLVSYVFPIKLSWFIRNTHMIHVKFMRLKGLWTEKKNIRVKQRNKKNIGILRTCYVFRQTREKQMKEVKGNFRSKYIVLFFWA